MNIIITTNNLKSALQYVMGVVGKDLNMPTLSHVLIEKDKDQICVTGTNLEVQITARADCIQSDDFESITVSGKKLYDIVRSLDNQEVQLHTKANKVILKTKNSSFKLSTLPTNSFPLFEKSTPIESFVIKQTELLSLLNKTSFSMASNPDVRFILCGLLLEIEPNLVTAVATDAHRLAISSVSIDKKQINDISCIVPRKAVIELIRVLQGENETKVSVSNNQIDIDFKGLSFVSKLMDGKFPAGYKGVIPKAASIEVLLEKNNIRAALQRVSILANEKFKGIKLEASSEKLTLSSENPEQEEANETIEHQASSSEENNIIAGFNAGYLIEAINACSGDEVIIGLNGPKETKEKDPQRRTKTEGTLIFSPTDTKTKYVVMPYNI